MFNISRLDNDATAREINRLNLENVARRPSSLHALCWIRKLHMENDEMMCLYFRVFFYQIFVSLMQFQLIYFLQIALHLYYKYAKIEFCLLFSDPHSTFFFRWGTAASVFNRPLQMKSWYKIVDYRSNIVSPFVQPKRKMLHWSMWKISKC